MRLPASGNAGAHGNQFWWNTKRSAATLRSGGFQPPRAAGSCPSLPAVLGTLADDPLMASHDALAATGAGTAQASG